jgi:hypothetical protein
MATPSTFGSPNNYYAASAAEIHRSSSLFDFDEAFQALLEQHDPELQNNVNRAFKQWNLIIRDYLRTETGLRLSVGDEQQAVPVRVVAGLPEPLRQLLKKIPLPVLRLFLQKNTLRKGVGALEIVDKEYEPLVELINGSKYKPACASREDIFGATSFIKQSLAVLDDLELEKKIGEIEQDTLGAYFFYVPKIELYWMVIGLVARMLGVTVEGLTAVVAIHELAHAYTHLGKDIDRQNWQTKEFAASDLRIVEGLAQFYTALVTEKLVSRFPSARAAYEALLKVQPVPYKVHTEWADKPEEAGEVIRAAMIECRFKRICKYEEFEVVIDRHLEAIKGRKRNKTKTPDPTGGSVA